MKKILFLILIASFFISCEPITGCGTVIGGSIDGNETYLKVDFGDKVRNVKVDAKTFLDYPIGSGICFD